VTYTLVAGAISYGLAALSWHFFESRILGMRGGSIPSPQPQASDLRRTATS
jgi:hypothetical protein